MGHCKDCKHWHLTFGVNWGLWTTCDRLEVTPIKQPPAEGDAELYVDVADDHGLEVGLKTSPTFVCVKFQPRD